MASMPPQGNKNRKQWRNQQTEKKKKKKKGQKANNTSLNTTITTRGVFILSKATRTLGITHTVQKGERGGGGALLSGGQAGAQGLNRLQRATTCPGRDEGSHRYIHHQQLQYKAELNLLGGGNVLFFLIFLFFLLCPGQARR